MQTLTSSAQVLLENSEKSFSKFGDTQQQLTNHSRDWRGPGLSVDGVIEAEPDAIATTAPKHTSPLTSDEIGNLLGVSVPRYWEQFVEPISTIYRAILL